MIMTHRVFHLIYGVYGMSDGVARSIIEAVGSILARLFPDR